MGNKDKVTAATESQKKRVFSEHLYFSHPRLEAQTAAAFLQRERGRCCCDQGCFRDHSGRPHLLSAPPVLSQVFCPSLSSWSDIVSKGCIWVSGDTLKGSTLPGKPELLFPRTLTESAPKCTVWEWFSPPRTPETPTAVQKHRVLLCSCRHPFALHPAHRLGQLTQARLAPYLHCICISYHIWKKYDGMSFENTLHPIGMLFRKMRKISLRLISHC